MKLFGKKPLIFILFFLLSANLFGGLYEDKCQGSSAVRQRYIVPDDEKFINAKLKSEKLGLLADNYKELLSYFLLPLTIVKDRSFACSSGTLKYLYQFSQIATNRRAELTKKNGDGGETLKRRRALAKELIRYQRALHEIERGDNEIKSNSASYDYSAAGVTLNKDLQPQRKSSNPNDATHRRLSPEASASLNKLKLSTFAILNSYPILDTENWRDKRTHKIFSKPSDEEVTHSDVDYVMSQIFDKSLLEIQENILTEVDATCEQSTLALVVNDYFASPLIEKRQVSERFYCSKYNQAKNLDLLKNIGLVTLSVVAIAAAPLSGGSSTMALAALIVGTGAAAVDVGLAINDIDNYYDLKRAFLTGVKNDDKNPALVSYEEVRSAKTQAIISSILAGSGAVADSIGIVRTGMRYKELASLGKIGRENVTVTIGAIGQRNTFYHNLEESVFNGEWESVFLRTDANVFHIAVKRAGKPVHGIILVLPPGIRKTETVLIEIQEAIADLPPSQIDSLNHILIHPKPHYKDVLPGYKSTPGDTRGGGISIFPAGMSDIPDVIKKQFGYVVAKKLFRDKSLSLGDGRFVGDLGYAWKNAMHSDNTVNSLIPYVDDFAQTVVEYILTNGGKLSPSLRTTYRFRFMLLDKIFEADPRILEQIKEMARIRLGLITTATGAFILGSGGVAHYILNE